MQRFLNYFILFSNFEFLVLDRRRAGNNRLAL
jgi:hypothetical protein